MIQTEWRDIPGFEGAYQASSDGQIKSLARTVDDGHGRPRRVRERILSPGAGYDYLSVHIRNNAGERRTWHVHRLVTLAFHGVPPEGMEACHNDGDHRNNRADNLRWDTRSANGLDSVRHGKNIHALKTRCPQRHEYTEQNTIYKTRRNGELTRVCRACNKVNQARYYQRKVALRALVSA